MPSSLIFAALTLAWLVILVPMVARRRQDGPRPEDSAPTGRVLRSGRARRVPRSERATRNRVEETSAMSNTHAISEVDGAVDTRHERHRYAAPNAATQYRVGHDLAGAYDDGYDDEREDDDLEHRRYRPGRGGYDPQAAAIAARAKYVFRQRVVLLGLLVALATGLLAGLVDVMLWWAHGAVDLVFIGYLIYLRRQVRIEQEIRRRRMARMTRAQSLQATVADQQRTQPASERLSDEPSGLSPQQVQPPGTVVVQLDDDDPAFAELDESVTATLRRAAGE